MALEKTHEMWTSVITSHKRFIQFNLRELVHYRDLIVMLVKRYFVSMYKQTILGPLWIIITPLLTTVFFTVVFGNIAQLSTDGLPQVLFYMAGTTIWGLFSNSFQNAATTFTTNSGIFSKVYFPRLAMPIASTLCACVNFLVQFVMFLCFYAYFLFTGANVHPQVILLILPLLILHTAILGMAMGIIITAITTKYKDLTVLVSFGAQLLMYATPIVYPASTAKGLMQAVLMLNPMSPIIEAFRYAFMGVGLFSFTYLLISVSITGLLLFIGLLLFTRIERTFVDTI